MPDMKLFHFPGACSRVSMHALEHIGQPFEDQRIDILNGEHTAAAYRATNPRGKVPALLVDGQVLSENAAILLWLNMTFPDAKLFPKVANDWQRAQQLSDLFWLSATWHPYVRANRAPMRWTTGDTAPVQERGKLLFRPCLNQLEERLSAAPWWYGDDWSILDTYFYWCYTTAERGEFSLDGFAAVADHRARIEAMPCLQRTLTREEASVARAAA